MPVSLPSRRDFLAAAGAAAIAAAVGICPAWGRQEPPFKVGFILPEKGPLAQETNSLLCGFELFLKEQGKGAHDPGIVRKDPGPDEEQALEALAVLLTDKDVRFIIGPLTADASEGVVHGVSGGSAILFVTNPSVRLVGAENCLPQTFRVGDNTYLTSHPLGAWALRNVGHRVLLTGNDDTVGNQQADFFAAGFEKSGGAFVDRLMVSDAATKVKEVIQAVRKSEPDFIFASFRDREAAEFLKAYRGAQPRITKPVIGPDCLTAYPGTLTREGKNASGVRTSTTLRDPRDFVERIKRTLKKEVTHASMAAQGYDTAAAISAAVSTTGDGGKDVAKLILALEETEIDGPRGKVRFDKNHEPVVEVLVHEWEVKDKSPERKILENLGVVQAPDFGCGKVGFPSKPDSDTGEQESLTDTD